MKIKIALDYSSNFKINLGIRTKLKTNQYNYRVSKLLKQSSVTKPTSRIVCKHSIIMLMLFHKYNSLTLLNKNLPVNIKSLVFFFKASKQKYFTLLRAPYRYKIARNQLLFKRFFVKCSIVLQVTKTKAMLPLVNSYVPLWSLDKTLVTLYSDLDTNICTQNKINLLIPFSYKNFFLIKNY